MKTSQLGYYPNIGKQKGSCADYNANNSWYFNSTNGCVNNNNRYNGNFRSRPVLDYCQYDNELLENYPLPLSPLSEVFAVAPDFTKITIVPKYSTDAYYRNQYHQLKIQLP